MVSEDRSNLKLNDMPIVLVYHTALFNRLYDIYK